MSDENPTYSFGEYVRKLRLERHVSLTKAAKSMGMTPQKLSDIESGRRYNKRISHGLVMKMCEGYGVSLGEVSKNIQTSITNEKSMDDYMRELSPFARMGSLLAERMVIESGKYSGELEKLAKELLDNANTVAALIAMMQKNFGTKK